MVDVLHDISGLSNLMSDISGKLKEVGARLREERERLGLSQELLGKAGDVLRGSQADYEAGKRPFTIAYLTLVASAGVDTDYVVSGFRVSAGNNVHDAIATRIDRATASQKQAIVRVLSGKVAEADVAVAAEQLDVVEVEAVDQEYGMGATFADGPVQVDTYHFSRAWMDQVTRTAPTSLTWARGRGDSMAPTIGDGEMVLIDRSDRRITDTDAIWAFTIGDFGYMKRLRVRGNQVTILSDNQNVPVDHATLEEINLIGRVSRVVKRV